MSGWDGEIEGWRKKTGDKLRMWRCDQGRSVDQLDEDWLGQDRREFKIWKRVA